MVHCFKAVKQHYLQPYYFFLYKQIQKQVQIYLQVNQFHPQTL